MHLLIFITILSSLNLYAENINSLSLSLSKNYKCQVFNLGNNKSEKILKVIKLLEHNLGKKAIINFHPMQPGDVEETRADISKSIDKLSYNPKINLEDGISEFSKWFLDYNKFK